MSAVGAVSLAGFATVGAMFGSFELGWDRKEGFPVLQTNKLHTGFSLCEQSSVVCSPCC